MRADIAQEGKSVYQIIILASIIEKEVREAKDMKTVSGIFWNRLKIGQPLQSDATLSYVLGDNTAAHSLAETNINSPYNTYRFAGLPPGPICNPSLSSIKAVVNADPNTPYWFYMTDRNGVMHYATTFQEHQANINKYPQ